MTPQSVTESQIVNYRKANEVFADHAGENGERAVPNVIVDTAIVDLGEAEVVEGLNGRSKA